MGRRKVARIVSGVVSFMTYCNHSIIRPESRIERGRPSRPGLLIVSYLQLLLMTRQSPPKVTQHNSSNSPAATVTDITTVFDIMGNASVPLGIIDDETS